MRRFIECTLPTSICNLECSYCYITQHGSRKNKKATLRYPVNTIINGLSRERLGGISFISITAAGETLVSQELPSIVKGLLEEGHFVNITTNGTLSTKQENLLKATRAYHARLHISYSMHFLELKKRHLIETFFSNIKRAREEGCSILLQINLVDQYIPYLEEIKELSLKYVGAYPQVALTRFDNPRKYEIFTNLSTEEYLGVGNTLDSPLFEFTFKNFNQKRREFCYAGYWTAKLNLGTGMMTGCYGYGFSQNIFEDTSKPISWRPIGNHCPFAYCINSSHFMSQGVIPELEPLPSYADLRNRKEAQWYTLEAEDFLGHKFVDENSIMDYGRMKMYNVIFYFDELHRFLKVIKRKLFNE